MKIAVFDSWNCKFTAPLIHHWEDLGHTVFINPQWEAMMRTDINFFYPADNVIVEASTQKIPHVGKVFVNCIDIEVWAGQPMGVDWTYVDGVTFISQHIYNYVISRITPPPIIRLIKPGINLDIFSLKKVKHEKDDPIQRIAYVVGDRRIWDVKRFDLALTMLRDLLSTTGKLWQLHILGSYSSHVQYNDYCEHLIEDLKVREFLVWYEHQESVSKWLNDKDFFFLASTKEAFSYATAEAMAKGITPIIGNWRGAKETWGPYYSQTYLQMYNKLISPPLSLEPLRRFVEEHYDEKRYFAEIDDFIGLPKGGESHG